MFQKFLEQWPSKSENGWSTFVMLGNARVTENHIFTSTTRLQLKKDKCIFQAQSVIYLGHWIDTQSWKKRTVPEAPKTQQSVWVEKYLSLLAQFLPNLAFELESLHRLLEH